MSEAPKVPIDDQVAAAEREVRQREHVYPRRVEAGRMTQAQADRELRNMRAIVETLKGLQQANRLF
jgi:hypothetical protein